MGTDYEVGLRAYYFLNACRAWRHNPAWMTVLADTVAMSSDEFGLKYSFPTTAKTLPAADGKTAKTVKHRNDRLTKANIDQLEGYLTRVTERYANKPADENYAFLDKFFAHLEFENMDREIAELLLLSSNGGFISFFERLDDARVRPTTLEIISAFLGQDKKEILPRLKSSSPLLNSGMVYEMTRDFDGDSIDETLTYFLHPKILANIDDGAFDVADAVEQLLGKPALPETEWDDFAHIKADAELAANIIRGALRESAKGVNILVYGDTGVGKTEFTRVLAARLGVPLYPVGEKAEAPEDIMGGDNRRPDPSSPAARLADKRLVESLLGRRRTKALTMFDEMEDLLGSSSIWGSEGRISSFQMSKAATNNLLTQNDVPCLWTTNNIERFDPALLRRFSFAIGLKTPNADVRERVILRTLRRYGRELTSDQVRSLAENHPVPPAFFSQAIRSAVLADDGTGNFHANLQMGMRSIGRLVTGQPESKIPRPVKNYDLSLVNANANIADLTEKIIAGGHRNFSICAYGVSGAGKSEYLLHLADKMGLEAMVVPYSEIVSKWVGETEQNIRAKFEEAADGRKFLIFDEADSLLTDRRLAKNSWERTQVNEMLVQMQNHPLPFGCTTNLMNDIDQAALRRFSFKVLFKGLTRPQYQKAFKIYFEHELPQSVELPANIAPGDFANVLRQAKIMDTARDTDWLVKALRQECAVKGNSNTASKPILGFHAHLKQVSNG